MFRRVTVAVQEPLVLVVKASLQVSNLLMHDTILLGHMTDLLSKGHDLYGIADKTAPLLHNDMLGVMLQLEQVLGITWPCTSNHCGSGPERHCLPHPCEPSTLGQSCPGLGTMR
jgi:hypothetical protein